MDQNDNKIMEILLAEDNEDDAMLTIRSLKPYMKNELIWLKDGEEALNYLFGRGEYAERDVSFKPKVILLDLKMPKVDGIQVLKEIKSHENTKNIPVVIMTSSKEDKDLKTCYELGANSYVVKPIDFNQFSKAAKDISLYWLLINEPPLY